MNGPEFTSVSSYSHMNSDNVKADFSFRVHDHPVPSWDYQQDIRRNFVKREDILETVIPEEIINSRNGTIPVFPVLMNPKSNTTDPSVMNVDDYVDHMKEMILHETLHIHGVALFKGIPPLPKICKITSSLFVHMGLILIDEKSRLYLFESACTATNEINNIYPMTQISPTRGLMTMRLFLNLPTPLSDVTSYVYNRLGVPYKMDKSDLYRSMNRSNKTFDDTYMNSCELCANTLIKYNVLKGDILPNNYMIADFDAINPMSMMVSPIVLGDPIN